MNHVDPAQWEHLHMDTDNKMTAIQCYDWNKPGARNRREERHSWIKSD